MYNFIYHKHNSSVHDRLLWVFLMSFSLIFTACGSGSEVDTDQSGDSNSVDSSGAATPPADEVWLTPIQESLADLATDTACLRVVGDELLLNGVLEVPPQHHARLHAPIPAFVKSVRVKEGERVSQGQVLIWLEHPDILELQKSYLENSAKLTFLEAETGRQEQLVQRQATDRRTLEQSRSDYQSALAQRASLRAQLQRLHIDPARIDPKQLSGDFPVKSPFSGYITSVNAFPGQFTERTGELVGVLDLSHMHVELDLPESHLPQVQPKMPFSFSLTRFPERVFDAEVFSISRELNMERRTVRVHGHIEREQDPLLRPGMSVLARLPIKSAERLSVACGALMQSDSGWVAFQKLTSGRYRKVRLKGAYMSGSLDVLGEGIEGGTVWVIQGAGRLGAQALVGNETKGGQ